MEHLGSYLKKCSFGLCAIYSLKVTFYIEVNMSVD